MRAGGQPTVEPSVLMTACGSASWSGSSRRIPEPGLPLYFSALLLRPTMYLCSSLSTASLSLSSCFYLFALYPIYTLSLSLSLCSSLSPSLCASICLLSRFLDSGSTPIASGINTSLFYWRRARVQSSQPPAWPRRRPRPRNAEKTHDGTPEQHIR